MCGMLCCADSKFHTFQEFLTSNHIQVTPHHFSTFWAVLGSDCVKCYAALTQHYTHSKNSTKFMYVSSHPSPKVNKIVWRSQIKYIKVFFRKKMPERSPQYWYSAHTRRFQHLSGCFEHRNVWNVWNVVLHWLNIPHIPRISEQYSYSGKTTRFQHILGRFGVGMWGMLCSTDATFHTFQEFHKIYVCNLPSLP